MANLLTMADIQAILKLHEQGWSQRRIARELNVDRETVAKYVGASRCNPKPAKAPLGCEGIGDQAAEGPARPLAGEAFPEEKGIEACPASPSSDVPPGQFKTSQGASRVGESKPAKAPLGSRAVSEAADPAGPSLGWGAGIEPSTVTTSLEKEGCRSACEPYRQVILEKLEQGLSGQRIYQDLRAEGFEHDYPSVRRFVAKLRRAPPLPFRRMECEAGEEAQVDFGTGAWIELPDGKRRKSHVFRIVLSYSRKGYSEAVYRQTTEDFLRAIENAFWHFGGAPKVLVIDNLKAAVKHPDWYDPELTPKIQSFGEHYGVTILPTKPRTPRHKGKIESGVGYVQDNGLKAHRFTNLEEENKHLAQWEASVADTRWAENMLKTRGIEGVRVLQGLLSLTHRHDAAAIERACEVAFSHGAYRLRTIRQLLKRDAPAQETFDFLQEHPIIRSLSDYGKLVAMSFAHPWGRDQRPQVPPPNPHPLPSSLCSVSSTQDRSFYHE